MVHMDEPHPSLVAAQGSGSKDEPPLPFLQCGIITAHDAAGVIAAGLGARAAHAFNPLSAGDNSICPLQPPCNREGPEQAGVSGEEGDVGHWCSLLAENKHFLASSYPPFRLLLGKA